jgi:hypothetical protein
MGHLILALTYYHDHLAHTSVVFHHIATTLRLTYYHN